MAVCLLALVAGCPAKQRQQGGAAGASSSSKVETDPDRAKVVARVGEKKITVGMLSDEINMQNAYIRMRYTSLEQRKKFLENMARFEVLYQEAARRKLDQDPVVLHRIKRAMIDRMMVRLRKELVKLDQITDKMVEEHYQKNIALYQQPRMVRVSQIVTATRAEALKVLELAKKKPGDARNFAELVQTYSVDSATKARRGDLDFFSAEDVKIPQTIRDAAFGIEEMWQLSGVVQHPKGFAVLMKTGERAPLNRPLKMERDRIKNRLYNEKRLAAVNKYMEDLQKKAKVEIIKENLSKVKLKLTKSPPPPHAPH